MERINAGSRDPVFYTDEAKARLDADNIQGALEILDLADKNGCADNEFLMAIRARLLEQSGQSELASVVRMKKINEGIRDPFFYNAEAFARLSAGNIQGALEILDLADKNGCADNDYSMSTRAKAFQRNGDWEQATNIRMERINAGSREPGFYAEEAKARLDASNVQGALEILDLADKNGARNDYLIAIRSNALQQSGRPAQASALRMERIRAKSLNPAFYSDEAKARREEGDLHGALDILQLAEKNKCDDEITLMMRSSILRQLYNG